MKQGKGEKTDYWEIISWQVSTIALFQRKRELVGQASHVSA
jgi:hypothetical protein